MPYPCLDKIDRHENSDPGTSVSEKVAQTFFQACTGPTFYVPFTLILGVPDERRCFLVPESAFRHA